MKVTRRFGLAILTVFALTTGGAALAQQTYKVGSTPTGVPFTFLDVKTNTIQGIMVDIVREIAADAGFKVEVESTPWAALIPSLTGSKIDIIAAAMSVTPARQEVIDFSRLIFSYGEGLVVQKKDTRDYVKLEDMKGFTIGAQKGTTYIETLQKSGLFADVKIYDTISGILTDVNNGRIQAGIGDKPIIAYNLQQGAFPEGRLVKSYTSTMNTGVGLGVRKTDGELLKRINASLEKLQKNGTIDKILAKWGL